MLRNIKEIIEKSGGKFTVRLKCGHLHSITLKDKPDINKIYDCQRCEIKGQGVRSIIGHLDNGHRKNRVRPSK